LAQPRIFRLVAQALLGLLLLAWLPAVGDVPESPFLPQAEAGLSLSDLSDDGERDRETFWDRCGDGDEPFLPSVCQLTAGIRQGVFTHSRPDALFTLDLLEARRATGPPAFLI